MIDDYGNVAALSNDAPSACELEEMRLCDTGWRLGLKVKASNVSLGACSH